MSNPDEIGNEITHSLDDLITSVDALYETIDAFAGAVNERMDTFATRIEKAFAESPQPPHRR